jgi:hypothetical protein
MEWKRNRAGHGDTRWTALDYSIELEGNDYTLKRARVMCGVFTSLEEAKQHARGLAYLDRESA